MIDIIFRPNDEIYFYQFDNPNACSTAELISKCALKAQIYTNSQVIMPDKLNIICGSFYMINELITENRCIR